MGSEKNLHPGRRPRERLEHGLHRERVETVFGLLNQVGIARRSRGGEREERQGHEAQRSIGKEPRRDGIAVATGKARTEHKVLVLRALEDVDHLEPADPRGDMPDPLIVENGVSSL